MADNSNMKPIDNVLIKDLASDGMITQYILRKKLFAFCRVNVRTALVLSRRKRCWIGSAHGGFSGYCRLHPDDAIKCIREGSVKITKAQVSTSGFVNWSVESPFRIPFPISDIESWEPMEKPEQAQLVNVVFNPIASQSYNSIIENNLKDDGSDVSRLFAALSTSMKEKNIGTRNTMATRPVVIHKLDLLIDESRLRELVEGEQALWIERDGKEAWELKQKLEAGGVKPTRLNQLLYRALQSSDSRSAKAIWGLLESDYHSAEQALGVADTVIRMSETELVWVDEHGAEHTAKFKTIENQLPKLRKIN